MFKEALYCEGDRALELLAQRRCGVSLLEELQKLSWKAALRLDQGVEPDYFQRSLLTSIIL